MKKLSSYFYVVVVSFLLIACSKSPPIPTTTTASPERVKIEGIVVQNVLQARIGDFIFDAENKKYQKRTDEKLENGIGRIDVWERVNPLEKTKWYTPSLSSRIFTNEPPSFNSLFRLELEEKDDPLF